MKTIRLITAALMLLVVAAPIGTAFAHHSTAHSIGTRGR